MKKATRGAAAGDIENQIREILRQFARTILNTSKLRETAAKETGSKPSYIRAMLDQRGVGGLSTWASLLAYCFRTQKLDLIQELSRALADPDKLSKSNSGLTPSEQAFKDLDRIAIVNEDVKFQLATSLELMLKDLEKSLVGSRRKK
jgi:hypothetical protein